MSRLPLWVRINGFPGNGMFSVDSLFAFCGLIRMMCRWGATGINGQADQSDINNYKTGVTTIEGYLNQGHLTDNMATSYNVPGV